MKIFLVFCEYLSLPLQQQRCKSLKDLCTLKWKLATSFCCLHAKPTKYNVYAKVQVWQTVYHYVLANLLGGQGQQRTTSLAC